MDIDPEEIRRGYAEMSDEGILSLDREDLTDLARKYYDHELERRGLQPEPEKQPETPQPNSTDELVAVETYLSLEDAEIGRGLLQSAGITAYLDNEVSVGITGAGGLRLMVPASVAEQALEILESPISDEELAAQAEAAAPVDSANSSDQDEQ